MNPSDLFRHADMLASFRGEASKGRFGVMANFLYMSLSDGVGTDTVVKKLDIQMDYLLGDLGLRWRVLEGPRGWVDVIVGARYTISTTARDAGERRANRSRQRATGG